MPREKQETQSEQTVQATQEEQELNKLLLDRTRALDPQQTRLQGQALDVGYNLLAGQDLPGYLQGLPYGISEEVTQGIVDKSIEGLRPSFQSGGIYDSGMRAELETGTAADIRLQSEQYNQNLLLNLLNLAVGGQAQIQAPIQSQTSQLGSSLAGLRSTSGTTTQTSMNPFLKSFQQSLGSSLGSGSFGSSSFGGGAGGQGQAMAAVAGGGCWVAKEIFGYWEHPKTIRARFWINMIGPKWFKKFYWKHGEKFAKFISDKPIIKIMLRPLFETFSFLGKEEPNIIGLI